MKDNFHQIIETIHLDDNGSSENPLDGPEKREIVFIDIADNDIFGTKNYEKEKDARLFEAETVERGPLDEDWIDEHDPVFVFFNFLFQKKLTLKIIDFSCIFAKSPF